MSFSLSAQFQLLNTAQKLSIFKFLFIFVFVVIFYSLSFRLLPARALFLIVLHNGVKEDSRDKDVICYAEWERRIRTTRTVSWLVSKLCVANYFTSSSPIVIAHSQFWLHVFANIFKKTQTNNCSNKKRRKMC